MMKRISFPLFIALMLLLQGCIKEDLSACKSELLLRFRYTLNNQHSNLFEAEVHRVIVYVFDANGKFVESFSEQGDQLTNEYVMHLPLPEGTYKVVVYGGDFTAYSVGELNKETQALSAVLRKGVTDVADLRMELKNTTGADNYLYPAGLLDDLYTGFVVAAVSVPENQSPTEVDLIKYTKKIKVKISGIEALGGAPVDVSILALNGRYQADHRLDENHPTFKYTPISTIIQPDVTEMNLKMMRLVLGQSARLILKNRVTHEALYNEDMIEQIRLLPSYSSQADFDRTDEFVFEIAIVRQVVVTVSINGWIINNVSPDIQ
ncbi:MAG: FimB/Mfa2 family fimbrial subunit [Bacteroides sp.]